MSRTRRKQIPGSEPHGFGRGVIQLTEVHAGFLLAVILFLAAVLRLLALLSVSHTVYFNQLLPEEQIYHYWAVQISQGDFGSSFSGDFAPLPAYVVGLLYRCFGEQVLNFRILNLVLGTVSCYLIYLIARETADRSAGLLAALAACLYEPFIFYSVVPLKTSLAIFFFAVTVYLFVSILHHISLLKMLFLGLCTGLMLNVSGFAVPLAVLIPIVVLYFARRDHFSRNLRTGLLVYFLVGLVVAASPFAVRNYLASGEWNWRLSRIGPVLYEGNNLNNPGPYARPSRFAFSEPSDRSVQYVIEASRRVGRKLTPFESSVYWAGAVVGAASQQPGAMVRKQGLKVLAFFNRFEAGDCYQIGFMSRFATFFRWPLFNWWLVLPLGLAGMALTMRRLRLVSALTLLFGVLAATTIIFGGSSQDRLPAAVILIPLAVLGLERFASAVKTNHRAKWIGYLMVLLLFGMAQFTPLDGADDLTGCLNRHARILEAGGENGEAARYLETAAEARGAYSDQARIHLAEIYYQSGQDNRGDAQLEAVSDESFAAADKYRLLGDIKAGRGRLDEAVEAYRRSLEINSGLVQVYKELINLLWESDRERALKEYEIMRYILSFYDHG